MENKNITFVKSTHGVPERELVNAVKKSMREYEAKVKSGVQVNSRQLNAELISSPNLTVS